MAQRVERYGFAAVQNPPFMEGEWSGVFVVRLVMGQFEQIYAKNLMETAENEGGVSVPRQIISVKILNRGSTYKMTDFRI